MCVIYFLAWFDTFLYNILKQKSTCSLFASTPNSRLLCKTFNVSLGFVSETARVTEWAGLNNKSRRGGCQSAQFSNKEPLKLYANYFSKREAQNRYSERSVWFTTVFLALVTFKALSKVQLSLYNFIWDRQSGWVLKWGPQTTQLGQFYGYQPLSQRLGRTPTVLFFFFKCTQNTVLGNHHPVCILNKNCMDGNRLLFA